MWSLPYPRSGTHNIACCRLCLHKWGGNHRAGLPRFCYTRANPDLICLQAFLIVHPLQCSAANHLQTHTPLLEASTRVDLLALAPYSQPVPSSTLYPRRQQAFLIPLCMKRHPRPEHPQSTVPLQRSRS